jgi:hypothetical protein
MREIVRNCRICQDSMVHSPFMFCSTCLTHSEQVWNFIKKNPYVSIKDISVATSIPLEKVERMVNFGKERQQRNKINH